MVILLLAALGCSAALGSEGLSGRYCLQNSRSSGYLNQGTSSGAKISKVQVWSDCKAPESQWDMVLLDEAKNVYGLQNAWSKNWLSEDLSHPSGVHVWSDHDAKESQWALAVTVATEYTLKSSRSGFYLSQNSSARAGGAVEMLQTGGSEPSGRWQLMRAGTPPSPSPVPIDNVTVNVADAGAGVPASPFLTRCVGSGHAWLGLRQDWRDQLTTVHADLGTEFVRFHGLLDDDMAVYQGAGIYNFTNVDKVYDFIVSIGMRPIVEVSFMPKALARGSDTGFYPSPRECHVNPPADYDEWARMIQALGAHVVKRYGEDEVAKWFFEVWNEPNCGFFRTGLPKSNQCCQTCADMDEYMKLYNYTTSALKSVSGRIRVGGPATAQLGHVQDFIDAVKQKSLPGGEVVTSHIYPTDPMTTFLGAFESIAESARMGQAFASNYILSEFNSGLYGDDVANHDRAFAASFLFSFAADVLQKKVEIPRLNDFMASYWTFSDVFEEQGFPTKDFQNGFGMITHKGIPKPAYRAMQLLHLGKEVIDVSLISGPASKVKALALRSDQGTSRIVRVFLTNLDEPQAQLGTAAVTLTFDSSPRSVAIYRIDSDHTNPREVWEKMGKPDLNGTSLQKVLNASELLREELQSPDKPQLIKLPARGCAVVEASWTSVVGVTVI